MSDVAKDLQEHVEDIEKGSYRTGSPTSGNYLLLFYNLSLAKYSLH